MGHCNDIQTFLIRVTGLVQGVGFRPFIFKLAKQLELTGEVDNRNDGVYIRINANEEKLDIFVREIREQAPLAASIHAIELEKTKTVLFEDFNIVPSQSNSDEVTEISPDIGVCNQCVADMQLQPHRLNYPFTNCTHCGPRFTIVRELPYDRKNTTMSIFLMCDVCSSEYRDVDDRRFHAQPVACNHCGPRYTLFNKNVETHGSTSLRESNPETIFSTIADLISSGKVLAIKGLGGYHLMCDALNETAVERLRNIKKRESKPFAVMCRDIESAREIAFISSKEEECLLSWRRPVVLLTTRDKVALQVSNGLNKIGVMLPYLPFHHLMFAYLKTGCVVLTSGNISDEPVLISNEDALRQFGALTDAVVINNRDIHNRCDDSVVAVANEEETIVRRSRGYAPAPVKMGNNTEGIFGTGAELVNCFALGKGNQIIMSQHIGDLKNAETFDFYKETFNRYSKLFKFKPRLIVSDLHPDYLSCVFGRDLAKELQIPVVTVQHHHAHIVSCMAEHQLDEPVIGISMDGVGLGTDGHVWGGEFMIATTEDFERIRHLEYIAISGGDKVSYEPWRSAMSYIYHYLGKTGTQQLIALMPGFKSQELTLYESLLEKKINSFQYSSAGRLFDAVAALTGVCTIAGFHAEAPMRLESVLEKTVMEAYDYEIAADIISFGPAIEGIMKDRLKGVSPGTMSAKFHNTIVDVIVKVSMDICASTGIHKVVISGGTFQNMYLLTKLMSVFSKTNIKLFFQQRVPSNDGGIALGQVAIGAKRRVS